MQPPADTAAEGLWRSRSGARNNRGRTHTIRLAANERRTTAAASLPLRMAARNGPDRSRRAPSPSNRRIGYRHPATHPRHPLHVVTL